MQDQHESEQQEKEQRRKRDEELEQEMCLHDTRTRVRHTYPHKNGRILRFATQTLDEAR